MPANLTPDYKAAEAAYRKPRDPRERLECLREMLRVIPKHKGTDHLQGDIKRRIKEMSEELERPQRGGARRRTAPCCSWTSALPTASNRSRACTPFFARGA